MTAGVGIRIFIVFQYLQRCIPLHGSGSACKRSRIRAIPDVSLLEVLIFELTTKTWEGLLKVFLSKEATGILRRCEEISDEDTFFLEGGFTSTLSAEDPQLYDLELTVSDENRNVQEIIPQKVGFRRFEMKDGIMTLNGKRIVFKGVNRHEFSSAEGGKTCVRRGTA